jgi:hypothetical protein
MAGITARFTEKSARALSEAGFCREKVITDWKSGDESNVDHCGCSHKTIVSRSSSSSFLLLCISVFREPEFFARCSILNFPWISVLLEFPIGLGSAYTQRTWLHSGQAI